MSRSSNSALASLVVLLLCAVLVYGVFAWSESRCEAKGGHTISTMGTRYPICVDEHGQPL